MPTHLSLIYLFLFIYLFTYRHGLNASLAYTQTNLQPEQPRQATIPGEKPQELGSDSRFIK